MPVDSSKKVTYFKIARLRLKSFLGMYIYIKLPLVTEKKFKKQNR